MDEPSSQEEMPLHLVSGAFPWIEGVLDSWPPAPDTQLFRPPLDDRFTLRKQYSQIHESWKKQEAGRSGAPLSLQNAPQVDGDLHHHGRPSSAVEAYYKMLFYAWELLDWGSYDHQEGFSFKPQKESLTVPVHFHTKLKRTTSVIDLSHVSAFPGNHMHVITQRNPMASVTRTCTYWFGSGQILSHTTLFPVSTFTFF